MGWHDLMVSSLFPPSYSNEDITFTLVRGGVIFMILQFLVSLTRPAPYGRYAEKAPAFLTLFNLNNRLAWTIQECPAFLIPLILSWEARHRLSAVQWTILAAFMLHYFQRSFIFPLLIKSNNSAPFLPTFFAILFCTFNGFLQAHSIIYTTDYSNEHLYSPGLISGMNAHFSNLKSIIMRPSPMKFPGLGLFLFGFVVNIDSDRRLRLLRANRSKSGQRSGQDTYKIPHGGFFELVTAANYFGEICEWIGFSLAAGNIGSLFFATFSAVFLGTRGLHHHGFYLEKFKEYPKDRKAVIPFLI
eukprot:maker-scaffold711_size108467-snap-gene-0.26 protein:Tk04234 transcript:maker-scaffold711_size108467-snap-gene-0.26-mRNA-1 annotation:"steroid-5-alpha- alpha polypeptide 2a"